MNPITAILIAMATKLLFLRAPILKHSFERAPKHSVKYFTTLLQPQTKFLS